MYAESNLKERCQRILEDNGGTIADKASTILLDDPYLKDLRPPLGFISKNWRDPLTPALMKLACEAVGGQPEETKEAALSMNLMHLSFYIWDDMIDKAVYKSFKPTFFGKFGEGPALIIGGIASAKAFSILNEMDMDRKKRQTVTKLVWDLWTKMAKAETANLRLRRQRNVSSSKKLWIIKTEATDLGACLKIGATLGGGSKEEIKHLANYGLYLGVIFELWKSVHVTVNLTLELAEKLRTGALPYSLLWAMEHSEKIQKKLEGLTNRNVIGPSDIKEIVGYSLETKVLSNTLKIVRKFTKKAKEEIFDLKLNKATQTLKFFVAAQPQLFIESLLPLQL